MARFRLKTFVHRWPPIVDDAHNSFQATLAGELPVALVHDHVFRQSLAVIVSFLPLSFITGMMGPHMGPMALNGSVAMIMSMVVAFTITPWLSYHELKSGPPTAAAIDPRDAPGSARPGECGRGNLRSSGPHVGRSHRRRTRRSHTHVG